MDLVEVCLPLELGANRAVAVDEEGDGETEDATVEVAELRVPEGDRVVDVQSLIEAADETGIIVHGDPNDLEAVAPILILPGDELGYFKLTGSAPGCPEVEQDDLAAVGAQIERLVVEAGAGEVGGWLVEQAGGAGYRLRVESQGAKNCD